MSFSIDKSTRGLLALFGYGWVGLIMLFMTLLCIVALLKISVNDFSSLTIDILTIIVVSIPIVIVFGIPLLVLLGEWYNFLFLKDKSNVARITALVIVWMLFSAYFFSPLYFFSLNPPQDMVGPWFGGLFPVTWILVHLLDKIEEYG